MMYNRLGSRRFVSIVAALHAAAVAGISFYGGAGCARIVAKRHKRPHWYGPHQGVNEMARRRRQIERGTLTASNGLCISKGRRVISVPFDTLNRGDRVWFSRAAA